MKKTTVSKTLVIGTVLAITTGLQIGHFGSLNPNLYSFPTGGTLREKIDATCGACHNNLHFTAAGDFSMTDAASVYAGGVFAQSLGVNPTSMVSGDPLTALIVQKPMEESSMVHGGIKIPQSHPTMQALIAWVQNGAPANELDYPAQPALSYFGGSDPVLIYAKSQNQPGGFRDIIGNGSGMGTGSSTPDGDIWLVRYDAVTKAIIQNSPITNFPITDNVASPSPSLDGTKIVFARKEGSQPWRIWEINSDGTGLRQYPNSSGSFHDVQPFYLPYLPDGTPARSGQGGIGWLSNRANFRDEYETGTSYSLYVCDANGGNIRQIGFNPSHNIHPTLHSSGLVIFTDWQHNEHQGHNFMPLFSMTASDYESAGANFFAAYGEHGTAPVGNSLHGASEVFTPGFTGQMIAQASMRDASAGSIAGPFFPKMTGTVGSAPQTNIIALGDNFEPGDDDTTSTATLRLVTYRDPASLLDHYVVSKASFTGYVPVLQFNGATTYILQYSHFALNTFDLDPSNLMTNETELLADPSYSMYHAEPLLVRPTPPMIGKPLDLTKNTGVFTSGDIRTRQSDGQPTNLTTGTGSPYDITAVRFVRALQFSQALVDTGHDTDEGIATQIIGEAPVHADGSFSAEVPAGVPLQFQLKRADGIINVVHKPWVHVAPGETMRCVGCHAGHSDPAQIQTLMARQIPPHVMPASQIEQFHFGKDIQPIFDAKCVSCHDSGLAGGAAGRSFALSLSGRMTPANVSESFQMLTGGGLAMGMSMNTLVNDQDPDLSRLIWWLKGKNMSVVPPTDFPTNPTASVPHDQMLTNDELQKIIDWIAAGFNYRVVDDNNPTSLNMPSVNAFLQNVWPIIQSGCYSCHSTGGVGQLAMTFDDPQAESQADLNNFRAGQVALRSNFMIPAASTFLRKPDTNDLLTHGGGKMWDSNDTEYATIYAWIASANPALAPGVPGTDIHNVNNYPNPFRDSTTIVYGLSGAAVSSVEVKIYSQTGKLIRELPGTTNSGGLSVGWNRIDWDGKDKNGKEVGNDVYFYTIKVRFVDGVEKTTRNKCVKVK